MQLRFLLTTYEKILEWSLHPKALWYLALVSFLDSSLFPISPNFMLFPMSFAKPNRAFYFAIVTIVASIIGGLVGYGLGYFAFESLLKPFFSMMGYIEYYQKTVQWFEIRGFWAIFWGCLTPIIPYKIFTIGAGVMQLDLGWFLLTSALGRSIRFFLIAALIFWGGPKVEPYIQKMLNKA